MPFKIPMSGVPPVLVCVSTSIYLPCHKKQLPQLSRASISSRAQSSGISRWACRKSRAGNHELAITSWEPQTGNHRQGITGACWTSPFGIIRWRSSTLLRVLLCLREPVRQAYRTGLLGRLIGQARPRTTGYGPRTTGYRTDLQSPHLATLKQPLWAGECGGALSCRTYTP